MQLKPMTESDFLLFSAERTLDFMANFIELQGRINAVLTETLRDDHPGAELPIASVSLAKLVADLHKALLALHREATK